MDKTVATAAEAVADVPAGASLAVGGFTDLAVLDVTPQGLVLVDTARRIRRRRTQSHRTTTDRL
jgi:hypothetical protein